MKVKDMLKKCAGVDPETEIQIGVVNPTAAPPRSVVMFFVLDPPRPIWVFTETQTADEVTDFNLHSLSKKYFGIDLQ
jgi:hypothetical protein